ncbi:MAG: aminotransferase class IV, partial [Anaerolineae bacterium]
KGHILEGLSSNLYAVLGGTLHTADDGVLAGVARSILLDVAAEVLPVQMEPVTTGDIPRLEAAMLTSSSRGVVPIRAIGEQAVPVSAVVRRLQEAYAARIEAEMEPL